LAVPAAVTTRTGTVAGVEAGGTEAVSLDSESTLKLTGSPPKVTLSTSAKLSPEIVTSVPFVNKPPVGLIPTIDGGGRTSALKGNR
jgi:hypothetical protein